MVTAGDALGSLRIHVNHRFAGAKALVRAVPYNCRIRPACFATHSRRNSSKTGRASTIDSLKQTTLDDAEVAKFESFRWRESGGGADPLHALNPVRCEYISERVSRPLNGLRVVDVGCGGGLLSISLAARGAIVTGVDASAQSIAAAREAAQEAGVTVELVHGRPEELLHTHRVFDVVCALEVIEHVADARLFVQSLSQLASDGGDVFVSTLDRSFASWALAVRAAEDLLLLLPQGTHNWHKFIRPSELAVLLGDAGLIVNDAAALNYAYLPWFGVQHTAWRSTFVPNRTINYVLHASKILAPPTADNSRQTEDLSG